MTRGYGTVVIGKRALSIDRETPKLASAEAQGQIGGVPDRVYRGM